MSKMQPQKCKFYATVIHIRTSFVKKKKKSNKRIVKDLPFKRSEQLCIMLQ